MKFVAAPHERWAELAKRMHATEHRNLSRWLWPVGVKRLSLEPSCFVAFLGWVG
jgi:hypothetical protein